MDHNYNLENQLYTMKLTWCKLQALLYNLPPNQWPSLFLLLPGEILNLLKQMTDITSVISVHSPNSSIRWFFCVMCNADDALTMKENIVKT